jgi:hypothetical protein
LLLLIFWERFRFNQPDVPSWFETLVNVEAALVPIADTAEMQTTMMRDSITAYSTAVGPSSSRKKFLTRFKTLLMDVLPR